jgi:phosphatidylserine decarboxylase
VRSPPAGPRHRPDLFYRVLIALLAFAASVSLLGAGEGALPLGVAGAVVVPCVALIAFFEWFFRDPERVPGAGIVAPADGRIQFVQEDGASVRIAVFMNVTDVHVNRFPLDAQVSQVGDGGRGFAPAYSTRAHGNVQREYRLITEIGEVTLIQITGILARRLVSFVGPGDWGRKGARLGMIVLGSRVDVLLPKDRVDVVVRAGDRVRAGTTTIATERT